LFTNPVGKGWVGEEGGRTIDKVVLKNPRRVDFGLCIGSADLIGWMNGRFVALEVKPLKGRMPTKEQLMFLLNVCANGGIAGVVRSVADAEAVLNESKTEMYSGILYEAVKCKFGDAFIVELEDIWRNANG